MVVVPVVVLVVRSGTRCRTCGGTCGSLSFPLSYLSWCSCLLWYPLLQRSCPPSPYMVYLDPLHYHAGSTCRAYLLPVGALVRTVFDKRPGYGLIILVAD